MTKFTDRQQKFIDDLGSLIDDHKAEFHVEDGKIVVYLNAIPDTPWNNWQPQEEIQFGSFIYDTSDK